ncbi:MAG: hypothetical protein HRU26_09330, partial [Psychroserpens sp.]|nr:hypothetical protein [Psychroserpens sp.]
MLKRLLIFFAIIATYQFSYGQAPGADCASATPLTLIPGGTYTTGLQSTAATGNNYAAAVNCGQAGFYGLGNDGVYVIDVVNAGDHTFSFTTAGNTFKNFAIHNACPIVAGSCVAGGSFATGGIESGTVTVNLAVGTYYLLIDCAPFAGGVANFELEIEAPIANSNCSGAIELKSTIACSYQTYSNAGAGDSGVVDPGCAAYAGGDVWFSYVVNSTGELTVEISPNVVLDTGLALYSGNCGGLVLLGCDDDSGPGLGSSITLTGRTEGEVIYIRVWEFGNNLFGDFDICITTPVPVGDLGVELGCPGDDSCEMTSDLGCTSGTTSLGNTISGNLNGAPTAERPFSAANSTVCSFDGVFTRYEPINFTVTVTGEYVFDLTTTSGVDFMGYIVLGDGLF